MATIEIDGKTLEAENGKMIIEVADDAGIPIPRFCYHKKLSIAANCRMCLVQVENSRKPVPACATPITNGMKVFTRSEEALRSQKAVMDFLLINHPLDCPICDQGGECELQDLSMGYGEDHSWYSETKRSVEDDDLGPLISTEMTRCIHCTRCVRFGNEVAGVPELGATGRGENMQIGTFVKHSMTSEVSGNIIDLCPVGALTSKPYRFTARAWELEQHDSISPHDCLGTNLYVHVRRNRLMRVVPKENEAINETWISDRDRFSYLGLQSQQRIAQPRIKRKGQWETVDWETALKFTADGLAKVIKQHGSEQVAAFASPSSSVEELYLFQKLMRALGVNNLDHRTQQTDFRDQGKLATVPSNSLSYAELENQQAVVIVGCNLHREVPLAGLKVRKAYRSGAAIYAINPVDYSFNFELNGKIITSPAELPAQLAKLIVALAEDVKQLPLDIQKLILGFKADQKTKEIAQALRKEKAVILTGAISENHPEAALIRTLIHAIESLSGCKRITLTTGGNTAGAWVAGVLPHRVLGGKTASSVGLDVNQSIEARLKAYVLLGLEPGFDFTNAYESRQAMIGSEFVVMISGFANDSMADYADVILPVAAFTETSGTYINLDLKWQTVKGAMSPFGESRPAWKVLRVLGNLLQCPEFDYVSSAEILDEVKAGFNMATPTKYSPYYPESMPLVNQELVRVGEWPLYRVDMVVRHTQALQDCAAAETACIRINPQTANRLKLEEVATVTQGNIEITLPLKRDERIAPDVVWVANAMPETIDLGYSFAAISIKR